ncbi:hypothetical protein G9A89_014074 [Geosiphon pyriformis]|nr:hypothetical protein G9A89_014074 [Geosiphon pyriformis]
MSLSKPASSSSATTTEIVDPTKSRFSLTLPQTYGYLTIVQAGSAIVFSTFLVTHLSAAILANFGGVELANKALVLGRVYYQNSLLEPIIVFGSLWVHITSGVAKRGIRLFWRKLRKEDSRKLTGEVNEKIEKIVTDETNDKGQVVRQKITTKTTTTITPSYISRAVAFLLPLHSLTGYLLIPVVVSHYAVNRIIPRRYLGDSSLIDITYVTLALKRWPKSTYLGFTLLLGLAAYHVASGAPAAFQVISGSISLKKNKDRAAIASDQAKKRQNSIRNGALTTSLGLVASGLLVIGGIIGRGNINIPLRAEYLRIYEHIYPQSWVR